MAYSTDAHTRLEHQLIFHAFIILNYCFVVFSSEISIGEGSIEYKLKRKDDKSSCYECSWSTNGMSESKNKDRLQLVIFVKFADNKQINAKVQCKMYSLKDKNHITWGTCLKNLQLDCKIKDGQTYVDVQQVLFK